MTKPLAMPQDEWDARCDLAALYRLIAHFRMTDIIDTHLTLHAPGPNHHFLINQYGVLFDKMKASDLVLIDEHGNCVDEHYGDRRVNKAGFVIHSAIHMARSDMRCVIHTHTAAGIAVSAQEQGLLPISQHALMFYDRLSYHTYQGIALDLEEQESLISDLGTNSAMILRNHGLLVGGNSVASAFQRIHFLERSCQAQIQALAGGAKLLFPPREVCLRTAKQYDREEADDIRNRMWKAALTLIEDQKEDYCA